MTTSDIRRSRLFAGCLALTVLTTPVLAEHRVALLIGNRGYEDAATADAPDLQAVARELERFGFTCQFAADLKNENALRDAIERFATATPTRSTALLYFHGRLSDGPSLLAVDSRGKYAFTRMFDAFENKGGSSRHLIFVDAPDVPQFKTEMPSASLLTFGTTSRFLSQPDDPPDLIAALEAAGVSHRTLADGATVTGKGSRRVGPPDAFPSKAKVGDEWVNELGIVFCWCPPGKYIAGSPAVVPGRYPDEEQREVVIPNGFWLSKYELARSQEVARRRPGWSAIARHKLEPMTMINHDDARTMTRQLTNDEVKAGRLPADWQYALPTETQWEYAARAGTTTRFYFGDDMSQLPRHANFADKTYYDSGDIYSNSAHRTLNDGVLKLARVGSYLENPWGLHDMYGNVAEWCDNLAIRGGSWTTLAENCRSAYRDAYGSRNEQNFIGYRLIIRKRPVSPRP